MSLIKLMAFPCRRGLPYVTNQLLQPLNTVACNNRFLLEKPNDNYVVKNGVNQFPLQRYIHVSSVRRDMEAAFKCIGSGLATSAIIGPGIGMGILFGNLLSGVARNPSIAQKLFTFAIMGAALTESLAIFAIMIAFICIA